MHHTKKATKHLRELVAVVLAGASAVPSAQAVTIIASPALDASVIERYETVKELSIRRLNRSDFPGGFFQTR